MASLPPLQSRHTGSRPLPLAAEVEYFEYTDPWAAMYALSQHRYVRSVTCHLQFHSIPYNRYLVELEAKVEDIECRLGLLSSREDPPFDTTTEYVLSLAVSSYNRPLPEFRLSTLAEGKFFPLISCLPYFNGKPERAYYRKQTYGRRCLHGPSPNKCRRIAITIT
jgi:hypothetical protein